MCGRTRSANTSIIMLTAKALSADQVRAAFRRRRYIISVDHRAARALKGTLRRARRCATCRADVPPRQHPHQNIERQVREAHPFAVLYCDLDNFKAYNDQKGFVRGDRLIQTTARIIQDAVVEKDGADSFVGHVGGDDFVVVVDPETAEAVAQRVTEKFDEALVDFYDPEDLDRGVVRIEDRKGGMQDIPLVATSVGIASSANRAFAHYGEAVSVATEMKQFAKRDQGSSYAIDQRSS